MGKITKQKFHEKIQIPRLRNWFKEKISVKKKKWILTRSMNHITGRP